VNDFDRRLEFSLRRRLDPVVAAPVPVRHDESAAAIGEALVELPKTASSERGGPSTAPLTPDRVETQS